MFSIRVCVSVWMRVVSAINLLMCQQKNVYVADLTEELVTSPEQALSWITKGESKPLLIPYLLFG